MALAGRKETKDDNRCKEYEENAEDDRFLMQVQAEIDPRYFTAGRAPRFRPTSGRLFSCSLFCSGTSSASHSSNVSGPAIIAWIMLTCRGSVVNWEHSAI